MNGMIKVGFNLKPTGETPLKEVLLLGLEGHLEALTEISSQASKEFILEKVCDNELSVFSSQ